MLPRRVSAQLLAATLPHAEREYMRASKRRHPVEPMIPSNHEMMPAMMTSAAASIMQCE